MFIYCRMSFTYFAVERTFHLCSTNANTFLFNKGKGEQIGREVSHDTNDREGRLYMWFYIRQQAVCVRSRVPEVLVCITAEWLRTTTWLYDGWVCAFSRYVCDMCEIYVRYACFRPLIWTSSPCDLVIFLHSRLTLDQITLCLMVNAFEFSDVYHV